MCSNQCKQPGFPVARGKSFFVFPTHKCPVNREKQKNQDDPAKYTVKVQQSRLHGISLVCSKLQQRYCNVKFVILLSRTFKSTDYRLSTPSSRLWTIDYQLPTPTLPSPQ